MLNSAKRSSEEWKSKIRRGVLLRWQDPEYRSRLLATSASKSNKLRGNKHGLGYRHTSEAKQRISAAGLGHQRTVGLKFKLSAERRAELGARLSAWNRSLEGRARTSFIQKRLWANPGYKARAIRVTQRGAANRPTSIEKIVLRFLQKQLPGQWLYVGDGSLVIGGKNPDFVSADNRKQLIEVFGRYWHQPKDEVDRCRHFSSFGFETLVLWEEEIKSGAFVGKVLTFNSSPVSDADGFVIQ